ncbi:MAG: hypothetical protein V3S20_05460 [Dehalococcoidia bacterium]
MATQVSRQQLGVQAAGQRSLSKDAQVIRFDVHQRIQHFLMMSSFIVLALTGLPQRFSELGVSQWWVGSLGGLETVRTIHRLAAFVMLTDCAYHVGYLFYRIGVQRRFGCFRMVPTFKDLGDGLQTVRYFLGLAPEKPKFDRFSYLEKFDYWAVFWGIAIIGGSGLMLMFPVAVTRLLPGQAVSVALILHADEAILAVGWILIMHMFNVHLSPWVFPFNPAIFTGKMSAKSYAEDHPLEWASLEAAGGAAAARADRRRAGASESAAWAARARNLVVLVGKKTRMTRARVLMSLLVVVSLLLAGPLGWADGSSNSPLSPEARPTPTPTPTPTSSPAASSQANATPTPAAEPTEPAVLTHRLAVVQQFLCESCHRPDSGWLLPDDDDHAVPQGQACNSCHAPAPEPSPVAIHDVPGDTATQELCTLCHRDVTRSVPRQVAPQISAAQACSSCHEGDERADTPADHAGRSVTTCSLCHETQTLVAQAVPHKVASWEECSFCHGEDRLAPLKGGHQDLADDECLRCHDGVRTPPIMTKAMLDYSQSKGVCTWSPGEDLPGPLPPDDAGRAEVLCALCHSATGE